MLGAYNLSKLQKEIFKEILLNCVVYSMNEAIKDKCIFLRNNYKIKTPDAIIAATALVFDLPLLTSDADFKKINELKLIFIEQ